MVCAVIFTAEYQRGLIAQPIYYYLNSKKDEIDEISLQINPSLVSLVVISIYAIKYATTHELWWKEPAFFLMFLDVGLSIVVVGITRVSSREHKDVRRPPSEIEK